MYHLLIPAPNLGGEIINSPLVFFPQGDQLCTRGFQSSEQELTNRKYLLGNSGQVMASLKSLSFPIHENQDNFHFKLLLGIEENSIYIKYLAQSLGYRRCAQWVLWVFQSLYMGNLKPGPPHSLIWKSWQRPEEPCGKASTSERQKTSLKQKYSLCNTAKSLYKYIVTYN